MYECVCVSFAMLRSLMLCVLSSQLTKTYILCTFFSLSARIFVRLCVLFGGNSQLVRRVKGKERDERRATIPSYSVGAGQLDDEVVPPAPRVFQHYPSSSASSSASSSLSAAVQPRSAQHQRQQHRSAVKGRTPLVRSSFEIHEVRTMVVVILISILILC
jgi:hypothetical protein